MRILHVSDIHFNHPGCTTGMDADSIYREHLLIDVQNYCAKKKVSAIFITGDIAFKAAPEEYVSAKLWIDRLIEVSGCPVKRTFVVPGNHDVDQGVIKTRPEVREAIASILGQATLREKEVYLNKYFHDSEKRQLLFAPLANYNQFAAQFDCQVYPQDRLHWEGYLDLPSDLRLKVYGLTTTLVSGGRLPLADQQRDMFTSPFQTQLMPEPGVINVVLGHHPPDWCADEDEVNRALEQRAALHYFGHKHRSHPDSHRRYMRFYGGAVNPDRYENGWEPSYSITDISVERTAEDHAILHLEATLRRWQSDPERFVSVEDTDHSQCIKHMVRVPLRGVRVEKAAPVQSQAPKSDAPETPREVTQVSESTRAFLIRFFALPRSRRKELIDAFKLAEGLDSSMPEHERSRRAILKAAETNVLEQIKRRMDLTEQQK